MMDPDRTPDLLTEIHWAKLDVLGKVLLRQPIRFETWHECKATLAETQILLTSWGCPRLEGDLLAAMPELQLVAHAASSVKPIVSDGLWSRGIKVTSSAAANAIPVAEFALAAILLANKDVQQSREYYRTVKSPSIYPWTMPGRTGNYGAVVGIVGASRTGRHLLGLLRHFSIKSIVFDPIVPPDEIRALGATPVDLPTLAQASDVISIHTPLIEATRHLIDARFISRLRDGATLINTARGEIIDQAALEVELASGRLNAVLDVTDPEPLPSDSLLLRLPNVLVTPHIAGAAGAETRRLADLAIDEIGSFIRTGSLDHEIRVHMLSSIG